MLTVAGSIASFGPLDVAHGKLLATPKPHWAQAQLRAPLLAAMPAHSPCALDTDVNAAAMAGEERQELMCTL